VTFEVGDKVIYPNHGLGIVERIEEKTILGTTCGFYHLRIVANETTVLVPLANVDGVGLRRAISDVEVERLFGLLGDGKIDNHQNWKGRFKDNSDKMRSGSIYDVADVPVRRSRRRACHACSIAPSSSSSRKCPRRETARMIERRRSSVAQHQGAQRRRGQHGHSARTGAATAARRAQARRSQKSKVRIQKEGQGRRGNLGGPFRLSRHRLRSWRFDAALLSASF
jgi:RNA polymerase-interacting CarD/CdnL/TRCF family regulator